MYRRIKIIISITRPFIKKLSEDNVYAIAGQSTFYFILASVPLMMFAVSILQNLHIPQETLEQFIGMILNERATDYLSSFLSNAYADSSGISIITLLFTLWSASKGIHAIINGFNRVHKSYENRNWFLLRLKAMVITFVLVIMLFAALAVFVLGDSLNHLLQPRITHLPDFYAVLYDMRYLLLYVYLIFIFAVMYSKVPNIKKEFRKNYSVINQLPGAILCATAWFVLSVGISVYVDDFNGFSIYGGLTRLAVIMVWLYWCLLCLMFGAEVNVVYHSQITTIRRKKMVRKGFKRLFYSKKALPNKSSDKKQEP